MIADAWYPIHYFRLSFGKSDSLYEQIIALQKAAPNGRLQDLPAFDIVVSYLPENGIITTDVLKNCKFKENKRSRQ